MKVIRSFSIGLLAMLVIKVCAQDAQKFEYTRKTSVVRYPNEAKLVANVSGNHHLLVFSPDNKVAINVYNKQLEFTGRKELSMRAPGQAAIKIIPFKNSYFLYAYFFKSNKHELWTISASGTVADISVAFNKLLISAFKGSDGNFQWITRGDHLDIVGHTYYKDVARMITTVLRTDSLLNPLHIRNVAYAFKEDSDDSETLQQIMMPTSNDMFVLKKRFSPEKGSTLELIRINLFTGAAITTSYSNRSLQYGEPGLLYNTRDSSVVLYSLLRAAGRGAKVYRSLMICRLDHLLNEMAPVTLVKARNNDNTSSHFLLLNGELQYWIGLVGQRVLRYSEIVTGSDTLISQSISGPDFFSVTTPAAKDAWRRPYQSRLDEYTGIRFMLLDKDFRIQNDSLVRNDKRAYYILPDEFARFRIKNKSCLLLTHYFSAKRKGLLLVRNDGNNHFVTDHIRVHDRYNYILSQLQQLSDDTIIVPYLNGSEAGLVRIRLE